MNVTVGRTLKVVSQQLATQWEVIISDFDIHQGEYIFISLYTFSLAVGLFSG